MNDQIKCTGREVGLRRNVYPRFISSGKMTDGQAAQEIAAMDASYKTLKALKVWLDAVAILEKIAAADAGNSSVMLTRAHLEVEDAGKALWEAAGVTSP